MSKVLHAKTYQCQLTVSHVTSVFNKISKKYLRNICYLRNISFVSSIAEKCFC